MTEVKISAADVAKLRTISGAGMMDCKKALEESGGDFEAAQDWLRKKGIAKAAKREDRETTEGLVVAMTIPNQTRGVVFALGCETDFVARNEKFIEMGQKLGKLAVDEFPASLEAFLALPFDGSTVKETLLLQTGTIGEKIEISKYATITGAQILPYVHSNNKLGVLVAVSKRENAFEEAGRNVAMQIAALAPVSVSKDDVPEEIKAKELQIGREQAREEGKPDAMLDKIAEGRLNKFFQENTLLAQKFVKDNNVTVDQYLRSLDKDLTVTAFHRCAI